MQHVEADFVRREPSPLDRHPPEGSSGYRSVLVPTPRASPILKQGQFFRRLLDEVFDDVLIADEVRTLDGVESMQLEVVIIAGDRRSAALRRNGVTPHRVHLAH